MDQAGREERVKTVGILPVGEVARGTLEVLGADLEAAIGARCELLAATLDPRFALHPERRQYHSTEILGRMAALPLGEGWRLLGVTDLDIFIPVLTFVFGEAQVGGPRALVSTCRLRQEFYGLPADPAALRERLLKEAVHEIGHTMGLTHCDDRECVMASSHAVEWIDLKGSAMCAACLGRAEAARQVQEA